jgi:hypothetical protein
MSGKPRRPSRRAIGAAIECLEPRRLLSTILVTTLADSGAGTLRAAVAQADLDSTPDTIQFQSGLTGTIDLSTIGDTSAGPAALVITNNITILESPTGGGITIDCAGGAPAMRLFTVASDGNLTLENLTLSGGLAQGGNGGSGGRGGGGGGAGLGGAIFNLGSLTINNCTLTDNQAIGGAGGIGTNNLSYGGSGGGGMASAGAAGSTSGPGGVGGGPNGGTAGSASAPGSSGGFGGGGGGGPSESINTQTQEPGNGGFGGGGGARGFGSGAGGNGGFGGGGGYGDSGGIGGFGGGNMDSVTYGGGGGAGLGGAIFNDGGNLTVTNSTFTANIAEGGTGGGNAQNGSGLGGAIFNYNGEFSALNTTISLNSADSGRGIYNLADGQLSTAILINTIVGQSDTSTTDYVDASINGGSPISGGDGDLIRTNIGFGGTIVSTADPQLEALSNNGGPTPTMLPGPNSPAINAGDNSATSGLTTDQRGLVRVIGSAVDIGSVETGAAAPAITSPDPSGFTLGTFGTFTIATTGNPVPAISETNSLPPGLTFTDNGNGTATLFGTPQSDGEYPLTIQANNGSAIISQQSFTLTINQAIAFTSSGATTLLDGRVGRFAISTSAYPIATISLANGALPSGLTLLDNGNGTASLFGTPAADGVYDLTISASNGVGPAVSQSFTLTVTDLPTLAVGEMNNVGTISIINPDGLIIRKIVPFPAIPKATPVVAMSETNGVSEIIAAVASDGCPKVKIFNAQTGQLIDSFLAFPASYRGGLSLAVGDVNDDGTPDIIVAQAAGGGTVNVYDGSTFAMIASFTPYGSNFTDGIRVASVDFNDDGYADIVTSPGPGTAEPIEIFDGESILGGPQTVLSSFYPFGSGFTDGVYVAAGDINGTADVIASEDAGGEPLIEIFNGQTGVMTSSFLAFNSAFSGGVRVGLTYSDDGEPDILAAGGDGNNQIEVFSPDQTLLGSFRAGRINAVDGRNAA